MANTNRKCSWSRGTRCLFLSVSMPIVVPTIVDYPLWFNHITLHLLQQQASINFILISLRIFDFSIRKRWWKSYMLDFAIWVYHLINTNINITCNCVNMQLCVFALKWKCNCRWSYMEETREHTNDNVEKLKLFFCF